MKWGKATKTLHKKRPDFLPIVDSVVVEFFWSSFPELRGSYDRDNAETLLYRFRNLLADHAEPLEQIRATLEPKGFRLIPNPPRLAA